MWWCCGKTQKEARGCKFSKHEKQDEDEEDEDNAGNLADNNKFNMKCRCCKEVGHQIEACPRDPNIRTLRTDIDQDYERIKKIKDYRKLYADTVVMTTQLLKKCVLVPLKQSEEEEKIYAEHPFKRGSMKFDDFNYQIYNPYILVEDSAPAGAKKGRSKSSFRSHQIEKNTEVLLSEESLLK